MSEILAGRELNQAVHEALGLAPFVEYWASKDGGQSLAYSSTLEHEVAHCIAVDCPQLKAQGYKVFEHHSYPCYSTCIEAAWKCVAYLQGKGWGYMLHDCYPSGHWAGFSPRRDHEVLRGADAKAADPAEAICRAFLALLEKHPELKGAVAP